MTKGLPLDSRRPTKRSRTTTSASSFSRVFSSDRQRGTTSSARMHTPHMRSNRSRKSTPASMRQGGADSSMRSRARAQRRVLHGSSTRRFPYKLVVPIVLLVLVLLVVGGGVLYASSAFMVTNVKVTGVSHLTNQEMTTLAQVPEGTTLLRVDTTAIKDRIMRDAWVKNVDVIRIFPDTLELKVTERSIAATVDLEVDEGKEKQVWALSQDGIWLCSIPDPSSPEAAQMSPQIYEDQKTVLNIKDVAYGVKPEIGEKCTDKSIINALDIVTKLTTKLKDEVKVVKASSLDNTTLVLDSNVEVAFGTVEDSRDKERVVQKILDDNAGKVSYINVTSVNNPTWRTT